MKQAKPPWQGRLKKPKKSVNEYMSNVEEDKELILVDILGSIAHAKMLSKQGILTEEEGREVVNALKEIYEHAIKGSFYLRPELEDVHMNIEHYLIVKLGETGKKLHTARSRNDQVNLDMRLYLRESYFEIGEKAFVLIDALVKKARKEKNRVIPAYTHTRRAQPITAGYYLLAQAYLFNEIFQRIHPQMKFANKNPLGACAISGTSWEIDKEMTAEMLGFDSIMENSLYAISSRGDQELKFLFLLSIIGEKLSKLANDLILYSSEDFGILELADEHCTGSSVMPQKKNPDVLELMRSRMSLVISNLNGCFMILKNLPTGHNADTQEIKKLVFSSKRMVLEALEMMIDVINRCEFKEKEIEELICATEVADFISKSGIPFRTAHNAVGACALKSFKKKMSFKQAVMEDSAIQKILRKKYGENYEKALKELERIFDLKYCISLKETAPEAVEKSSDGLIIQAKETLKKIKEEEKKWERKKKELLK